jgi:hypothetical protein
MDVAGSCKSLDATGYTNTLDMAGFDLTVSGNVVFGTSAKLLTGAGTLKCANITIPTFERESDIAYVSPVPSGLGVDAVNVTRDKDYWDPFVTLTWSGDSQTYKDFYTPPDTDESGTIYVLLFDGTYYYYGEYGYYYDFDWGFTSVQNRCRNNASARLPLVGEVGGVFQMRVNGALLVPDATAKIRMSIIRT